VELTEQEREKIRLEEYYRTEVQKPPKKEKISWAGNPLISVLIGFVLTSIIGGSFGYWLQQRSFINQHKLTLRDTRWTTASKLFESVSTTTDTRIYRERVIIRLMQSIPWDNSAISDAMKEYRIVRSEWNARININYSGIGLYFGKHADSTFSNAINQPFIYSDALIEQLLTDVQKSNITDSATIVNAAKTISAILNPVADSIFALDNVMNDTLSRGTIAVGE